MTWVAVYPNPTRDRGLQVTAALCRALLNQGVTPVLHTQHQPLLAAVPGCVFCDQPFGYPQLSAVFTVGGDGTILAAITAMQGAQLPLIGVNTGRVSYLAEVDPPDIAPAIARWLAGDYTLDQRMMLAAQLPGQSATQWIGLNDAVIDRGAGARLLRLQIEVDGQLLTRVAADGMIFATPTGSTAYAMSAGGPILAPQVRGIVCAPICAHALYIRPVIVPDDATIRVVCLSEGASLQVDGRAVHALPAGGEVLVRRAQRTVSFIRLSQVAFYQRLHDKLGSYTDSQA